MLGLTVQGRSEGHACWFCINNKPQDLRTVFKYIFLSTLILLFISAVKRCPTECCIKTAPTPGRL